MGGGGPDSGRGMVFRKVRGALGGGWRWWCEGKDARGVGRKEAGEWEIGRCAVRGGLGVGVLDADGGGMSRGKGSGHAMGGMRRYSGGRVQ